MIAGRMHRHLLRSGGGVASPPARGSLPPPSLVTLRGWGSVALLLVLSLATAAHAAPGQPAARARTKLLPVAVALTDNASAQTTAVAVAVESAARQSTRHVFVDPVERFDPLGVETRRSNEERGQDGMVHGRKAFDNLEVGLGTESFERAITALEQSALWRTFPRLIEALTMRLVVKWSEDPAAVRRDLAKLVSLDPKVRFPPELTPPDLELEVQRARQVHLAEPKFAVDVSTTPVAARVYVNGIYRGTAPVSVRGLAPGEHYVSLVAPGYAVVQQKFRAGPGAAYALTLKPAERSRPVMTYLDRVVAAFGEEDEVTSAQSLARMMDAEEVLVAGVRRRQGQVEVELHRIAGNDGHVLAVETARFEENAQDLPARVENFARRVLAHDRPRGPNGERLGIKSGLSHFVSGLAPTEDRLKVATLVASGAFLVAGGTMGVLAWNQQRAFREIAQVSPEIPGRVATGRSTALWADLLVGAGLAAGGTWAYLEFGRKFARRTDIEAPPLLEQRRDDGPPKKPELPDDPFAGFSPEDLPLPEREGSVSLYAAPTRGGGVLGLRGTFQ